MSKRRKKKRRFFNSAENQTTNKTEETKATTKSKVVKIARPSCHIGPVEVYKNVFVGSMQESIKMVRRGVDVLVPLAYVEADIWNEGWRGEILYIPVPDYGVLPMELLIEKATEVANLVKAGKSVGIFCFGGHGRTGYFASVVLGFLGVEDPVKLLREHYCKKVIETDRQLEHVAIALNNPDLYTKYEAQDDWSMYQYYGSGMYGGYDHGYWDDYYEQRYGKSYADIPDTDVSTPTSEDYVGHTCQECLFLCDGICDIVGTVKNDDDPVGDCPHFDTLDNSYKYSGLGMNLNKEDYGYDEDDGVDEGCV